MNKVVHFEIPVDDVKRAQKFYGEVFGKTPHKKVFQIEETNH